jgi:hypothetical protein
MSRTRTLEVQVRRRAAGRKGPPPERPRAAPTPERIRHAGGDFELGRSGQIAMRDSPLERALARKVVTPEQY